MPEIIVHAAAGRSAEQKKALMLDITEAVVKNFGVPAELVVVSVIETPRDSKMRAGKLYSEM